MTSLPRPLASLCLLAASQLAPAPARAEPSFDAGGGEAPAPGAERGGGAEGPSQAERSGDRTAFHADAEIDPTAYAMRGYSIHVGLGHGRARLDLGAYAMDLPRFVHGDDGFDVSFDGFGAKVHYFFFGEQRGLFAGVDGGVTRVLARRQGTDLSSQHRQLGVGAHIGFRISLPAGFYATPWIGVGYAFDSRDVELAGATFKASPITVFPAIHLGYAFR